MGTGNRDHWEHVYNSKKPDAVSWYQPRLERSIGTIVATGIPRTASIVDVGGGASTLAGDLLRMGFLQITVVDISRRAIDEARARLGPASAGVTWIISDIFEANLARGKCDLWHDRALFHFLLEENDRLRYRQALESALRPGGFAVIATFGPNGPLSCSGLPTARYSPESLGLALGPSFSLLSHDSELHHTPFNTTQEFIYCTFRKV